MPPQKFGSGEALSSSLGFTVLAASPLLLPGDAATQYGKTRLLP